MVITAYTDGSSRGNPGPSGCGAVLINESTGKKTEMCKQLKQNYDCNFVELLAVKHAIRMCDRPSDTQLTIYTDSMYVIGVCRGQFKPKKNTRLIRTVKERMKMFKDIDIKHVRGHSKDCMNDRANLLARRASRKAKLAMAKGELQR